jgi:dolichol-phosphate mannosyltransferase
MPQEKYKILYEDKNFSSTSNFSSVIPCIQEEKTIGKVIKKLKKVFGQNTFIVVVVNDQKDPTVQAAILNGVTSVIKSNKKGYGAAIKAGLNYIQSRLNRDIPVIIIDGDDTYDIIDANLSFKNTMDGAVVIGRRILKENSMRLINRIGNLVLNFLFRLFFYKDISDSQSGFKIFPLSLLSELKEEGMSFSTEIVLRALDNNMRIIETDITYIPRMSGSKSKLSPFKDGIKISFYFAKEGLRKRLGVGVLAFLLSEVLLFLGYYLFRWPLFWSMLLSGEISIISGFFSEVFLFRSRVTINKYPFNSFIRQFSRYNIIFLPALAISVNSVVTLYYLIGLGPLLANLMLSIMLYPINYKLYTYLNRGIDR